MDEAAFRKRTLENQARILETLKDIKDILDVRLGNIEAELVERKER